MAKKIKIGDCFERNGEICIVTNETPNDGFYDADWATETYKTGSFRAGCYQPIPTLHLPIGNSPKYGGAWFDLIRTGEKKEEYREVTTFYRERLCSDSRIGAQENGDLFVIVDQWKGLKVLHLTNGYGHSKPQLWAHIEEITIGRGNPEWGAPVDRDVFIIKLGAVFHTKNLKS